MTASLGNSKCNIQSVRVQIFQSPYMKSSVSGREIGQASTPYRPHHPLRPSEFLGSSSGGSKIRGEASSQVQGSRALQPYRGERIFALSHSGGDGHPSKFDECPTLLKLPGCTRTDQTEPQPPPLKQKQYSHRYYELIYYEV